jgi:hypothetical protein
VVEAVLYRATQVSPLPADEGGKPS